MGFRVFLEKIDLGSREVIVKQGEVLYHGTVESFDTRSPRTGGYDNIFWTTDDLLIARSYIPSRSSSLSTSINSLIRDEQHEGIRKSLGLTKKIIDLAWKKDREHYEKIKYWEDKHKEYSEKNKKFGNDDLGDEFYNAWIQAEDNYKNLRKEYKSADKYLKSFVLMKMRAFGYEPINNYYAKILTDDNKLLLPADKKSVGKVLKVTCNRDFKFYNYAYGREGDLMDPDYHKIDLFKKMEEKGFDGIVINDYAQSDHHGNYGHISYGFFSKSIKDLKINQIKNQTHPDVKDWDHSKTT